VTWKNCTKKGALAFVSVLLFASSAHPQTKQYDLPPVATFSIVAIDPATGQLGVAVASRYFSVGSVVPWSEADVGAIATQANVNVGYGPRALELLRAGKSAPEVLKEVLAEDAFPGKDGRQVAVIDAKGDIAAYTGPKAPNWAGDKQGKTWSAQGNILAGPQVPVAIGAAFDATKGELAEKLYAAVKAGDAAGGDSRGKESASILVTCKQCGRNINNDRWVYINVDDAPDPFPELRRLLNLALLNDWQDRSTKLLNDGKIADAHQAATKAIAYAPERSSAHINLGLLDYAVGDKDGALAEFRKAKQLEPDFSKQLDAVLQFRPTFNGMLNDKVFMEKVNALQ
jgi:uncharacterized Ntn-hydrolase superfamily protein